MRDSIVARPAGLEQDEGNTKSDSLSQYLAAEAEVLANDHNVRRVVQKARDAGLAEGLSPEQIEERAVENILWIYPVGHSRAAAIEAVRRVLG